MVIQDLRGYLAYLSKNKRLLNINDEVDPELEISAFTDIANRESRYDSKTLMFNKVRGYDIPVVTSLFGSSKTVDELFNNNFLSDFLGSVKSQDFKVSILKGAKALMNFKPKLVRANHRNYAKLNDLSELPILKVWPKDAGRYITLPLVISRGPKSGTTNVGVYRMQVFDSMTTGMHWQAQKGGAVHAHEAKEEKKELNVSVVIGTDPYNIVAAVMPLPTGLNEFAFAGFARNSKTVLMENGKYPAVPANSEIIINGHVDPEEKRIEGPFGDHTGYYSIPEPMHVFHVDQILAKKNAIYAASVVGYPWHEDAVLGQFYVEFTKPIIKMMNESIVDIYLPPEGLFTHMCFIKIKKRFPGEAVKAMFSVLGTGQLSFIKMIAVFDEDINIRDFGSVMWAMATRVEPQRDVQIISRATTDTLDHTSNLPSFGSKMLIDATKKTQGEGYAREWPETILMPDHIMKEVEKKWQRIKG